MIFFSKMTGLVPSFFFLFSSLSHLMPFISTFSPPRSAMEATTSSYMSVFHNDEGETFRHYMCYMSVYVPAFRYLITRPKADTS